MLKKINSSEYKSLSKVLQQKELFDLASSLDADRLSISF